MGTKKLSDEQEKQLVEEYKQGASVQSLMQKYGFATKKSITDKVKKHYPDSYSEILEQARRQRKDYDYTLEKITSPFDAYFIGLMLTDGYVTDERRVGIDLTDEDCIQFLSKTIGHDYKTYAPQNGQSDKYDITPRLNRHRLILSDKALVQNLARFGVVANKSLTLQPPNLLPEEEQYLPYIIRGIIDGDGCVTPTSYGGAYFYIVSQSKDFIEWLAEMLVQRLYMMDIIPFKSRDLWKIETANQYNIQKLIALVYDRPFGMNRKYEQIRKTFRDYNNVSLLEDKG